MAADLRYISLFSGMEAASAAIERLGLGWKPVAFAEIDPAASAVLAHKWPTVPNLGDITKVDWAPFIGQVDVVLGGSPCQSFSVAGKRLGLNDRRGNLALEYLNVVSTLKPKWFLYENVPGLLSSGDGRDFGAFLRTVADIGYSAAWRLLDARHFGVAQRRRRLFVVGHAGEWEAPSRVLALAEGVSGDQIPGRPASEGVASHAGAGVGQHDRGWLTGWRRPARRSTGPATEAASEASTFRIAEFGGYVPDDVATTCMARDYKGATDLVVSPEAWHTNAAGVTTSQGDRTACLRSASSHNTHLVTQVLKPSWIVRRLTPTGCLRLQGFDDDWLDGVMHCGKPLSDSQKYKLAGNSWAVPCAAWVIERIAAMDAAITNG